MAITIEEAVDETGVPKVVQKQILEQETAMWQQTRYRLTVRHRVNKKIGADESVLAALVQELEQCEKVLDALSSEMKALA